MKRFLFTNTIKNQLNMSKKLLLLLITVTTFANVSYAQSEVSLDAGITTEYGANLLAINHSFSLSEKISWHATVGFPSYSVGLSHIQNKNKFTIVINDSYARDWRLRIAYSKEKSISEKLFLVYGVRLILAEFSYGTRAYGNGANEHEVTGWETNHFMNTVGSIDVLDFLPFPFICLRYKLSQKNKN